jgi:hypothetical protein
VARYRQSLHIVAEKPQPMATVETILAVPGRGLEGDRYANGKGTYSIKAEGGPTGDPVRAGDA